MHLVISNQEILSDNSSPIRSTTCTLLFSLATFILLVTSMKLLRHGFSGANRVFLNFFFAEVLFTCDFPGLSETFPLDYFFVSIALSKASQLSHLSFCLPFCIIMWEKIPKSTWMKAYLVLWNLNADDMVLMRGALTDRLYWWDCL